ncbi:MAG: T9SS type A sorting domain-containing protein [Fluviicola sp.]|nr:T9SS type A sorting domain-containing protein [Fluviicola sp.]
MGNLIKIVLILVWANFSFGQISFFNYYTDNGIDLGEGVVQLEDSSYVVTGSSSSFSNSSQAFLMKIDSLGNFLWSNSYGSLESESGRRVLYKKSFGFYICGYTNSIGTGGFDFYLVKTDTNGVLEWENSYGGTGWERVHDAIMTADTGAIMVGESSSNPTDNKDIYIVRTDINGDTLWTKTIGGLGDDFATSIASIDDSTYVIGGHYYVTDSLLTKGWVCKIHENGTIYWDTTYGNYQNSWINDVAIESGVIRCVGGASGGNNVGINLFNSLMDFNGSYWGEFTEMSGGDYEYKELSGYSATNNYYVGLSVRDVSSYLFGNDILINTLQPNFAWLAGNGIANEYDDAVNQIIRTSDNGAIIVGYSTGVVSGGNEMYVCKIGPNGEFPDAINYGLSGIVSVLEQSIQNDVRIYPNPSSGVVHVATDNYSYEKISVLNAMGQVIYTENFTQNFQFDLSSFPSGYYILQLEGNGIVARNKILIQH